MPGLALFYSVLVAVVGEKEQHFRVGLQMMGVRTSVFWATWFLLGSSFALLSALFLVLTARAAQITVFANTQWPVFLMLYVLPCCCRIRWQNLVREVGSGGRAAAAATTTAAAAADGCCGAREG